MIKIIMHGCNGKMGQVITKIAEADSKVEIVAHGRILLRLL